VELRVSFAPFKALFKEMKDNIQAVRNISKAFQKAGGNNPTNRNTLMADIIDSGLALVVFPTKMAAERFSETLYKLP
jgi:phage-related minor tail protein